VTRSPYWLAVSRRCVEWERVDADGGWGRL